MYKYILAAIVSFFVFGCNNLYPKNVIQDSGNETVALVMQRDGELHTYCSGVWISKSEILTANHCVEAVAEEMDLLDPVGITIEFKQEYEVSTVHGAKVIYTDPLLDLSLVKAIDKLEHKTAKLAESVPQIGEKLYFVGHPGGLEWTHVEGVVAAYREEMEGVPFSGPFMQVSAPIWFGNSGGGSFNSHGELTGIASFAMRMPNTAFYISLPSINKFLLEARD